MNNDGRKSDGVHHVCENGHSTFLLWQGYERERRSCPAHLHLFRYAWIPERGVIHPGPFIATVLLASNPRRCNVKIINTNLNIWTIYFNEIDDRLKKNICIRTYNMGDSVEQRSSKKKLLKIGINIKKCNMCRIKSLLKGGRSTNFTTIAP